MANFPTSNFARIPPRVTGTGGVPLVTGQVVTGAAVRDVIVDNGIIRLTYEFKSNPAVELMAHTLYARDAAGAWISVMDQSYGDWYYITSSVHAVSFNRITIVEASADAVELACQIDAFDISAFAGGGPISYDDNITANYPEQSSTPKKIPTIKLVKSIRMERGAKGYFIGTHTSPRLGPPDSWLPALNNMSNWGERENGTGGRTAAVASSAGVVARFPAWGARPIWGPTGIATNANRPAGMGIDDSNESPWNSASFIATQWAGFPHEQANGPFWVLDIHEDPVAVPFAKIIAMRQRYEIWVWQFSTIARGEVVIHYVNEYHSPLGVPYLQQVYIGVEPYVADATGDFANEPSALIQSRANAHATALVWPSR